MNIESMSLTRKFGRLVGTAALAITGVIVLGFSGNAKADSGPYYVTYPGYCNVKQLYVDIYGNLYGREVGCSASYGEPMVGVSASEGVRVSRVNWSTGHPCIETYWYDGTLSGLCSDGYAIQYEPTYYYGVRSIQAPGTAATLPRITWKLETQQPDLAALKNLPSFSK